MRDHGGNLDAAIRDFGGTHGDWLDLSTGINPLPYPVPQISEDAWSRLPTRGDMERLRRAAGDAYRTKADIVPVAGAQAAIQILPQILNRGMVRIVSPTYNEYAAGFARAGWRVEETVDVSRLSGADVAVVVNPNNPDGRHLTRETLFALGRKVGLLVVDESFADTDNDLSLCPILDAGTGGGSDNILVLRSFGKFYGLAGLRLGFAIGAECRTAPIRDMAGPWPVSGPAIETAVTAFRDQDWKSATIARLRRDSDRLARLGDKAGWTRVGGTPLFGLFNVPDAAGVQTRLAKDRIWTRVFPYESDWIRLGLPGTEADWRRLEESIEAG